MVKKNENIDPNTRLKYELYGQLAACIIMLAAIVSFGALNRDKDKKQNTKEQPKIEKTSLMKSIVTDSISRSR